MKLSFKKEFDGDLNKLPKREVEGSTPFKEPKSLTSLSIIANIIGGVLMIAALIPVFVIPGANDFLGDNFSNNLFQMVIGAVLLLVSMPVHELLHAICFREQVDFYTYLKKGLLFVIGTEDMTKARFIFMCLLPNIVFGLVPYVLFFIFPTHLWLGFFGAVSLGAGAGDYINVFNALTQMPKGSVCYMSGTHSYWYMPKK